MDYYSPSFRMNINVRTIYFLAATTEENECEREGLVPTLFIGYLEEESLTQRVWILKQSLAVCDISKDSSRRFISAYVRSRWVGLVENSLFSTQLVSGVFDCNYSHSHGIWCWYSHDKYLQWWTRLLLIGRAKYFHIVGSIGTRYCCNIIQLISELTVK